MDRSVLPVASTCWWQRWYAVVGNLNEIVAQAHPLKSSAAIFGAVALSGLASDFESTARAGDEVEAPAIARRLRAIEQATREQLDEATSTRR